MMGDKALKITPWNLHRYVMGGLLLLTVALGAWLSFDAGYHADVIIRRDLLRQASSVASALSLETVRKLTFRAEDAERPAFQRINSQLATYAQAAGIGSLYTMSLRDGQFFFGPEGLPPDDAYATPPGTLHQKPSSYDFEAFRSAEHVVYGPVSDEFGEFITAIIPVVDPHSREVLMAVGVDMEASVWRKRVLRARWMPVLAMLPPICLLLLGYLVQKVYKEKAHMRLEYLRNIQVATYFAVMLLLTLIAFVCVRDIEENSQHELIKAETHALSEYYMETFKQIDFVLHVLTGFFEASDYITREEFRSFCEQTLEHNSIQAIYWLPALSSASAPAFTAQIQAEGFPDFSIRRFANDNLAVPDPADPIYPAVYIEPASRLTTQLGYDFYSDPTLRETLLNTLRSEKDSACMVSASTSTAIEPSGLFVFVPVSHTRQGGFIGISIDLNVLVANSSLRTQISALSETLFELKAGKEPQLLACTSCDECDPICGQCNDMLEAKLSARAPLFAFGKTYMLLFTAEPQWFSAKAPKMGRLTLGIGLVLTLLLTYTAAVLINRPLLLAKKVMKSTRELAESKERLDIAISAAKMGVWETDWQSDRLIWNDRMLEIYGIQREEYDGNGATWTNYIHPDDRTHFAQELAAAKRGERDLNTEIRIIRTDGEIRHILAFGKMVRRENQSHFRMIGVNLDITERTVIQQALEESHQLLYNIIDTLPERVWWKDLDSRFMGCNIHVAHDAGFDHPDQVIGKTDFDLPWAGQAEKFVASDRRVIESGVPRLFDDEFQVLADGMTRWISTTSVPLKDTNGKIIGSLSTYSDVTDRKQAELALVHSEAKYRELFEQSMDAFLIIKNTRFVDCNRAAIEMLRCKDKKQLLNMHPAELSPERQPDGSLSRTKADEIIQRMKDEKTLRFEWIHKRADGEPFPVEVSLTSITDSEGSHIIHTMWRDITERKQAEENLIRLSTAIEQSPESIVITDLNGNIQYINPAFEANTGYAGGEVLGHNPRILKSEEHPDSFYKEMWETLASGRAWAGRITNRRKNGTLFTEEATISPIRDLNGNTVNYVAVKRDISGELVQEEELRQAQKMEAVGELAGGVAHDFNNILQGIIGFSELLRYSLNETSQEYENANEIHKAANRAAKLTQQLLTFSRKQSVRREEIDLNNVVSDSKTLLHVLLGDQYEVVLDLSDKLPPAYADQGQLSQIIMNLAVNARDAMPEGGRLCIATECILINEADAAYIAGARPGRHLCLAVTDTGAGMDAETINRIFEPFFTTKELGAGTGLGLAVIYGIVKQNNGWINVYSEIGKGSCFRIYLPIAEAGGVNAAGDSADEQLGRNARILLIEDDPEILSMVQKVLGEADLTIIAAGSAEEGLVLFDQYAAEFDLLMSDMELPGLRGDELAEALRKKNPDLPVLLVSGYRDQVSRWKHLAEKGYLFLNKPFTITMLLDTVRNILKDSKGAHG